MQEASSASTDPDISPPTMSQSSSNISSSIPNSQFYSNSDNHNSLNAETHNSRFASSLAELITENENKDLKANLLHRASVVANTSIRYEKNQLLQLIHEHLVLSGLNKTAEVLKKESCILPLMGSSDSSDTPVHHVKQVVDTKHKVSLGSIVSDYLSSQHALCRSPMTTIPKFDLLQPHKCPCQRPSRAAAPNFTARQSKKDLFPPCGGRDGSKLDRKLIYSRFRPVKSVLKQDSDDYFFASCAFSGDSKFLFSGTGDGKVKMWNLQSSEKTTFQFHNDTDRVHHILSSKDSKLLITSASFSKLWSVGDSFELKKNFKNIDHLEFSNLVQDKA